MRNSRSNIKCEKQRNALEKFVFRLSSSFCPYQKVAFYKIDVASSTQISFEPRAAAVATQPFSKQTNLIAPCALFQLSMHFLPLFVSFSVDRLKGRCCLARHCLFRENEREIL